MTPGSSSDQQAETPSWIARVPDGQATSAGSARSAGSAGPAWGRALPELAVPSGATAVPGLGEKFHANPAGGTTGMTIPLPLSPARSGFEPKLSLSYDSGAVNGPFGVGWQLSLPSITRKTDRGLPRYLDDEESDVYILAGAEDLVPVTKNDGTRWYDDTSSPGYVIHRYRPRCEGLFARIERWTRSGTGEVHWRSISRDNITTLYGTDDGSRVTDPADSSRTFSWLIADSRDDVGNAVIYDYVAENAGDVDIGKPNERHRVRTANRYLKRVRYGNLVSHLVQPDLTGAQWLFEAVFDYDEAHYSPVAPTPDVPVDEQFPLVRVSTSPAAGWAARPDPFSTYRATFEIRTYRRCVRVLCFHHIPDLPSGEKGYDGLVRALAFDYQDLPAPTTARAEFGYAGSTRFASMLCNVTESSYVLDDSVPPVVDGPSLKFTYRVKAQPTLELGYSVPVLNDDVRTLDPGSFEDLPVGIDGRIYQFVDLDGEGLSGVLTEQAGSWFYKPNLGAGQFAPANLVRKQPSLVGPDPARGRLLDVNGNGRLDIVSLSGPVPGYSERTDDADWQPFQPFNSWPQVWWDDPNLRFVDLTGDGHADVVVSEQQVFTWYESLAEEGFGAAQSVPHSADEELGARLVFADETQSIHLADMSGDGLVDLLRVRNGETCYWPNLGYGRFGSRIVMDNSPVFDTDEQFNQQRIVLTDIDGSGTSDIVHTGREGARIYLNQSGNRIADPVLLAQVPPFDDTEAVMAADLLGTGTACLVWSSSLPGDANRPLRYVDLLNSTKPRLLTSSANNIGAETQIQYAPSTQFYLADARAGHPWVTRLPMPVQVVERVTTLDRVSGNRFVSRYAYHHGCFDGYEREFRGFAMVEQWDTEEFAALDPGGVLTSGTNVDASSHVPPSYTRTWFHTGVAVGRSTLFDYFAGLLPGESVGEYYREPGLTDAQVRAQLLSDSALPAGLTPDEEREACRALRGMLLRQETYGLDGSPREQHPYGVTERNYAVSVVQHRFANPHAVFLVAPSESLVHHYEREPDDPRVAHSLTIATDDFGNVLRAASIGYGRRQPDPALSVDDQAQQTAIHVTYSEGRVTNSIDLASVWRTPVPCESQTLEITGLPVPPTQLRFTINDLDVASTTATAIGFEVTPTPGILQKRLIARSRTYYRHDDLTGLAPLATLESLALPGERFRLALTQGLVDDVFGVRVTTAMLTDDARFVHSESDADWWIRSGQVFYSPGSADTAAQEKAYAAQHFYLPLRYRDPFYTPAISTESVISYDPYDLLLTSTRDALDNVMAAGRHNYRVLLPELVVDANANRTEVAYDILGMIAGTAVMGKALPAPAEGDSLAGFQADLTRADLDALLADPTGPAALAALQLASTRVVYDADAYARDPAHQSPSISLTIAREFHVSDLAPDDPDPLHVALSYTDGIGREIQTKAQVPAGPVPLRDGTGAVVLGADGQPTMSTVDVDPRWAATGWTVFDNNGNPVRQYEPFFSDRHTFEFDVRIGVSPTLFYDPVGRHVATLHADHTFEKTVFDPWQQEVWDACDTLLIDPLVDADVGDYFARLTADEYVPSWVALRTDPAYAAQAAARWPDSDTLADEVQAATASVGHAGTPTMSYADSLGQLFLSVAHNRLAYSGAPPVDEFYETRVAFDISGAQLFATDAAGRRVVSYDHDLLGARLHRASMEAGERWSLFDCAGKALYDWDSRDHCMHTTYDKLHRPVDTLLQDVGLGGGGAPQVVGRKVYGESQPSPAAANLRGRVVKVYDQVGVVTTDGYDFVGNPVLTRRQHAAVFDATLDWSQVTAMQTETFLSRTRFDALGRIIQQVAPHSDAPGSNVNVIQTSYAAGPQVDRVDVWLSLAADPGVRLDSSTANMHAVTGTQYDAAGRQMRAGYGSGAVSFSTFDPYSHRLVARVTRRDSTAFPADCPPFPAAGWPGCQLQNMHYGNDPLGHVVSIRDAAQQTIFFLNKRVTPDVQLTYDAEYRLIEATGREHLGQIAGAPIPHSYNDVFRTRLQHPGDGNAMARYLERYEYDSVGNLTAMRHRGTDPANPGWQRLYTYADDSQLEPGLHSNRLTSTMVGATNEIYSASGDGYDAHGNMLRMPHLQDMQWDFRDELQMTRRQAINASDADGVLHAGERTWFGYDDQGNRARVVTVAGALQWERTYLGGVDVFQRGGAQPVVRETLQVMAGAERVAIVETRVSGNEPGVPAQLTRYQLADHLGSAVLEVDSQARVISYEEYTPFGSTSYQAVANQTETPKRYRFTGQERDDTTGFTHHGARYYAPWLGRWISTDPLGVGASMSLYVYCDDNPVSKIDKGGMQPPDDIPPVSGVGLTFSSQGVSLGPITTGTSPYVVGFGLGNTDYMGLAGRNTGLIPINIQDRINIGRGLGIRWPDLSSFRAEAEWESDARPDHGGLHPMYSSVMVQEALEGNVAQTLHFDLRGITNLTPTLRAGTMPGTSPDDLHSAAEARQGIAAIASTGPGERNVTIVIQHEEGRSTIVPDSNVVQGDPLPDRLATRVPNIDNNPVPPPPPTGPGGSATGSPTGTSTTPRPPGVGVNGGSPTGSPRGVSGGRPGGTGPSITAPSMTSAGLGTVGRAVPGVAELESGLLGAAYWASGSTATSFLVAPLMTAATAVPVAAGAGVVGAGAGLGARALALQAGASQASADTIGFGTAVLAGAALGSFIPGVGTAVGAVIGGVLAGALYLWSIW